MLRWIKGAAAAGLTALLAAGPAATQDLGTGMPLSASDWLAGAGPARPPTSAARPADPVRRDASARRPAPRAPADTSRKAAAAVATSAAVPRVGVTRLAEGNPDASGAISAGAAGLPSDLWGAASAQELVQAIGAVQPRLAATRALLVRMLTAQLSPPAGSAEGDEGRLFLARLDRLIAMGLVPEAQALANAGGTGDPERFARRIDLAMYQGDATGLCRLMADRPGLAPDLPPRVFCLAQEGDWAAAALTLNGAAEAGLVAPPTVALLARFLDDASADLADPLPDPRHVTPLEFRLFEAIGQPLGTGELPLPFAWADLDGTAGWKPQIEAAERLARAGAIDPARLAAAYSDQKPAASGGVWDRAAAWQRLDAALRGADPAALGPALTEAESRFAAAGLLPALARLVAGRLPAALPDGSAARTAAHLRLLAGVPVPGGPRLPAEDQALIALAEGGTPTGPGFAQGSDGAAYAAALIDAAPPAGPAPSAPATAGQSAAPPGVPAEGRGMAMLAAMADIDSGLDGDVARAAAGLRRLAQLGQPELARRASVELLLVGGRRAAAHQ